MLTRMIKRHIEPNAESIHDPAQHGSMSARKFSAAAPNTCAHKKR
jgi:hypothetical protein